jgi:hypothetical protein
LPSEGQTAAHGQITERKYSLAHFRFSLAVITGSVVAQFEGYGPHKPRKNSLKQGFVSDLCQGMTSVVPQMAEK